MRNDPDGTLESAAPAARDAAIPAALSRWTATLLSRAAQRLQERFNERAAPLGIRSKHYGVLLLLDDGPKSQVEIGRSLWVDRTTMVQLVDHLERLRLVERERHPGDRRAHAVTLTDTGRTVLRQATAEAEATHEECFATLSADEQQQLRTLLSRLL